MRHAGRPGHSGRLNSRTRIIFHAHSPLVSAAAAGNAGSHAASESEGEVPEDPMADGENFPQFSNAAFYCSAALLFRLKSRRLKWPASPQHLLCVDFRRAHADVCTSPNLMSGMRPADMSLDFIFLLSAKQDCSRSDECFASAQCFHEFPHWSRFM